MEESCVLVWIYSFGELTWGICLEYTFHCPGPGDSNLIGVSSEIQMCVLRLGKTVCKYVCEISWQLYWFEFDYMYEDSL